MPALPVPNPMPNSTYWNIDWESYAAASGVEFGSIVSDPKYIRNFAEALDERLIVLYNYDNYFRIPKMNGSGYPLTTSHYCSSQFVPGTFNTLLGGPSSDSVFDATSDTYLPLPRDGGTNPSATALAGWTRSLPGDCGSGYNWAYLQALTAYLGSYFIQNVDENDVELDYNGVTSDGREQLYKTVRDTFTDFTNWYYGWYYQPSAPSGTSKPSGLYGWTARSTEYDHVRFGYSIPDDDFMVDFSNSASLNNKGNWVDYPENFYSDTIFSLSGIGAASGVKKYYQDYFPPPSGFRRKFPREIYSLAESGVGGWRARFTNRRTTPAPYIFHARRWHSSEVTHRSYGGYVDTPEDQASLSTKLFDYVGSGWVLSSDQKSDPDIVETHGLIHAGDYIGPWILNDLRDAINNLVWTYGSQIKDLYGNLPIPRPPNQTNLLVGLSYPSGNLPQDIALSALPHFYVSIGNNNFSNVRENNVAGGNSDSPDIFYGSTYDLPYVSYTNSPDIDDVFHSDWTRSYIYARPSGLSNLSGINRKYEFYNLVESPALHSPGDNELITSQGPFQPPFPSEFPPQPITNTSDTDYIFDMFGDTGDTVFPRDWLSGDTIQSKPKTTKTTFLDFIETDREGVDIGILVGNNSFSAPTGSPSTDERRGYYTRTIFGIAKWDVDGGFYYTKNTPNSGYPTGW